MSILSILCLGRQDLMALDNFRKKTVTQKLIIQATGTSCRWLKTPFVDGSKKRRTSLHPDLKTPTWGMSVGRCPSYILKNILCLDLVTGGLLNISENKLICVQQKGSCKYEDTSFVLRPSISSLDGNTHGYAFCLWGWAIIVKLASPVLPSPVRAFDCWKLSVNVVINSNVISSMIYAFTSMWTFLRRSPEIVTSRWLDGDGHFEPITVSREAYNNESPPWIFTTHGNFHSLGSDLCSAGTLSMALITFTFTANEQSRWVQQGGEVCAASLKFGVIELSHLDQQGRDSMYLACSWASWCFVHFVCCRQELFKPTGSTGSLLQIPLNLKHIRHSYKLH